MTKVSFAPISIYGEPTTATRYFVELKQRSGKWRPLCERDTLEQIQAEWKHFTDRLHMRELRCVSVSNGMRTVLVRYG